ncbi:plasmid transfer protein TraB [Kitasatospora sp. NPDC007106]|uniref:plasmid transfer protein TraB n=1 Tax=Kitasatospora sp. NPDC007106 TaxID=3156914 RepID=UPI0034110252
MSENKNRDDRHDEQLNGGSSGAGLRAYLWHRAKPYSPPWVGAAAVGLAGVGGNLMWDGSAAGGVGLTLSSVALTGAAWWAGRKTDAARRLHSAVTVAAASSWVTAAALAGPAAGPLPDLYVMGGVVGALSWNLRQVMRRNPDGGTEESSDTGLLAKVGLAKAKLGAAKVEPNRLTVPISLPAGEATHDDVTKALPRLASGLDVPTTAVRYSPDPDSARRGTLTVVPVDMLKEITWYPGASTPGGSVADPLVIGTYDNGDRLQLTLPQAVHLLIMGVTGAGKTEGALDVLAEILTRRDVIVWLSDPKRGQDLGEAFGGCDWVVQDGPGAEVMIEAIKAAIPARQQWLGSRGYRSWCPEAAEVQADGSPGMPYLVAWFEEAANTLRAVDEDAFTGIAQEARSAGITLVVSMQRASGYQISTDTRASLPAALCFGVDERDASFALPSDVLDAGANPGAWGNKRPGYCYLVSAGVAEPLWATPGRTFRCDPVVLEHAVRAFAGVRAAVDPVTAAAAGGAVGRAYTERAAARQTTRAALGPAAQDEDEMADSRVDPEDEHLNVEAELAEADDSPMFAPDGGHKPTPEEARYLFGEALAEFEHQGRMVVGPKDFMDWCEANGYSRPWVSERLKEAALSGRLEPTGKPGRWRIVPAPAMA